MFLFRPYRRFFLVFLVLLGCTCFFALPVLSLAADIDLEAMLDDDEFDEDEDMAESIADPFESVNRFFFQVNDKLYFWLVKPTGKVYSALLAEDVRVCISDAFYNALAPVRVVNHLLQGGFSDSGAELSRFIINTTLGAGGLADPAAEEFGIARRDADFGQTLGMYGLGDGFYIVWPLLGPSSARDSVGMAGDYFLNPLLYGLKGRGDVATGLYVLKYENEGTLRGEQYETIINEAFDPYVALRDVYGQYRRGVIINRSKAGATTTKKPDPFVLEKDCADFTYADKYSNKLKARHYEQCRALQGSDDKLVRFSQAGKVYYGTQFPNFH